MEIREAVHLVVGQPVDMSLYIYAPAGEDTVKEEEKKVLLPLLFLYHHPPLQVKWDDLMCRPVRVGNGVGG